MKTSINISSIFAGLLAFTRRFHTILFFLAVSGGLFAAIVMLLNVISLSSIPATSSSQNINGTFDEETIRRIKTGSAGQATPGGRQSPFVE